MRGLVTRPPIVFWSLAEAFGVLGPASQVSVSGGVAPCSASVSSLRSADSSSLIMSVHERCHKTSKNVSGRFYLGASDNIPPFLRPLPLVPPTVAARLVVFATTLQVPSELRPIAAPSLRSTLMRYEMASVGTLGPRNSNQYSILSLLGDRRIASGN